MPSSSKRAERSNLLAATALATCLEWYDFAVYGFLAAIIGKHFFPADDPLASLLASFGVFALGFLARPLGGVLFGHIGDKVRPKAHLAHIRLSHGWRHLRHRRSARRQPGRRRGATFLLVIVRICQGLSMGGEYTGSAVYLAENCAGPTAAALSAAGRKSAV